MTHIAFVSPAAGRFAYPSPLHSRLTPRRPRPAFHACASPSPPPSSTSTATKPASTAAASPAASAPAAPRPAFGRGAMMSRRVVGLWELKVAKLDPATLVQPDDKVESRITVGIAVFIALLFVVPVTTGVRLPEMPIAAVCAGALSLWAVDTLALNSRIAGALGAALSDRTRVARHEAGHFLVGYLLGFRPQAYALPDARGRLRGDNPGVQFKRAWASGDAHRVAAVGMAGIVAEGLRYGRCDGGLADIADVGKQVRECVGGSISQDKRTAIVRWGILVAARLIDVHSDAYNALVQDMLDGRPVEECLRRVDELVDQKKLEDEVFDLE